MTMKPILAGLLLILMIRCAQEKRSSNEGRNETNQKMELKEELPQPKMCQADAGKLKVTRDGYSASQPNELTELLKLLKESDCDIVEVSWIWESDRYDDMPKKLVYNSRENELKDIYTQTNVIETYSNIAKDSLIKYLASGKRDFYTLGDYSFDNTQMHQTALGDQPDQSEWDGSVEIVEDFVKANAHDASSVKFLEWSKVSEFGSNWIVRAKYKGTNAFGGVITENAWFYIQNDAVVKMKPIK